MSGARVPFDLELPFVVAAQELACGSKRFVRGDALPWREIGVSEYDLLQLYTFFKVDCVPWLQAGEQVPRGERRAIRRDDGVVMLMTAGERIDVETPKQAKQRRAKQQPHSTE